MRFLNDTMQAVVMIVCEKHAPSLLNKLSDCPDGNWFVLPPVAACRMGYWPHVSPSHPGQGCAIFGFIERFALVNRLEEFASINQDGSLCPDCVAYQWGAVPSHLAEASRDPVCGRAVSSVDGLSLCHEGEMFFFCSMSCRDAFRLAPHSYVSAPAVLKDGVCHHPELVNPALVPKRPAERP
jgi:YHS domain-containing protein